MTEKGKNANTGDRILIKQAKETVEGVLLESHEPGIILIKLDSGYNMGISRDNILDIKIKEKKGKESEEDKTESNFKLSHKKPIIDLIITGGTLSSSLDVKTGAVKFLTSPETLFKFYPEIFELADIRVINPFMVWSENMTSEHWIKIAKLVEKSLNDENVKGIIITHGTDFLHYTGAALSFMIKNINKPVILTYSQRSTDRASSDAELNLYCSAKMALSDVAEVMLVGHADINDDFCYALQANKCRKMHSSRRDAFKPINTSPIAKIKKQGEIEVLREYNKRKTGKESKVVLDAVFEDKVALLKFYPNQNPEILKHYLKEGYKGLIIEASGLGHVLTDGKNNWLPVFKEVISKRMIVCFSAQTLYGKLDPMVYEAGRKIEKTGVIYLKDMLPETSLVKLGYCIAKVKGDKNKIKELMLTNLAGEFNERLGEEFIC